MDQAKISVRSKLSALWATMMFLYVYADVLSLYRPGELDDIREGKMGPVDASQGTLLAASAVVIIPALMVFLSLILPPTVNRRTNLVVGLVVLVINVINLLGETWVYYWVFGVLEVLIAGSIVRYAWRYAEAAP